MKIGMEHNFGVGQKSKEGRLSSFLVINSGLQQVANQCKLKK